MEVIPIGQETERFFGNVDVPDGGYVGNADGSPIIRFDLVNGIFQVTGVLQFMNSASGLIFGSMHVPAVDITVIIGDANPTEVKNAAGDGWDAGPLLNVTFPTGGDEHYLAVPVAGLYECVWSLSVHKDAGPSTSIHGGIMIDGVAQTNDGEAHSDFASTDVSAVIGSPATADCPNGTEQISLWVSNDQSNDIHIDHGTLLVKQIGGT